MHANGSHHTRRWAARLTIAGTLVFGAVDASAAIPPAQRAALIALYNSTNGASWQSQTHWLGAAGTECSWFGVECDAGQTAVTGLMLAWNNLSGTLPAALGDLTSLQVLHLGMDPLGGTIPPELGNLTALQEVHITTTQLSGSIPPELGKLTNLRHLFLDSNQLSGAIPAELGNLTSLVYLDLRSNQLAGPIPASLGGLASVTGLYLAGNHLSGSIPASLGNLTSLTELTLFSNQLSGTIPASLGNLTALQELPLEGNQLSGEVPASLANLTNLFPWGLDLRWNSLYSSDASLIAFLDSRQSGGDWRSTQTVAATDLAVALAGPNAMNVSWTPITYTGDTGGYRVFSATTSGGPYTLAATTTSKSATAVTVGGLTPDTAYFFVAETFTNAHAHNQNTVVSERTEEVGGTTPCPPPSSENHFWVTEGDSGTGASGSTVALPIACSQTVTFDYTTADDTATTAGGDYVAASGTLTFVGGLSTEPLFVMINGDTIDEPNERFRLIFANPAYGIPPTLGGFVTIVDDDGPGGRGSAMPVELVHGLTLRRSLAALPGPAQEEHFFLLEQKPYSSYELAVDEISGDLQSLPGQPLAVELLAADGTTVVQESQNASPLGHGRSLRWVNSNATTVADQRIRIRSGGCTTDCGADDEYRLLFYETTCAVPRFNNAGSQRTVLILQNPATETVSGTIYFWSESSVPLASQPFTITSGATLTLDTSTVPGASGQSGSMTIANDGRYGALIGKATTLDPTTGFSFDTPMVARPR